MTIRFIKAWNGNSPDDVVTLAGAEETRLVGLGIASFDLDGANDGEEGFVKYRKGLTGGIKESIGGSSFVRPVALSNSFRAAKDNNPRVNAALVASVVAFGGNPTAGQVGYAITGLVTTGWTAYNIKTGAGSVLPFKAFGGLPYYGGTAVQGLSYYSEAAARRSAVWRVSFVTDAPEPVIDGLGYSAVYRINVNGRRCSDITASASGGYQSFALNLRGLGAGFHKVEILLQQDDVIAGIKIPKTASIFQPEDKPVVAMFTDSLGNTAPDVTGVDCLAAVMADHLGADVRLFAAGGTGYATPGSYETFQSRIPLAKAAIARNPDLVILAGGINDADNAAFQSAVEQTIALAKATFGCPVVVLGSWAGNTTGNQTAKATQEAKIAAAAASQGAVFVPVMTDVTGAWISGSGNTSATAGNGNADVLFASSDNTHWIGSGHAIIGRRSVYAAANALGL